jgi:hypothetical protein
MTLVLIVFVVVFVYLIIKSISNKIQKKKLHALYQQLLTQNSTFKIDKLYNAAAGLCLLALNINDKKLLLARALTPKEMKKNGDKTKLIASKLISFDEIVKSEIIVDDQLVSTKVGYGSYGSGGLLGGGMHERSFARTNYKKVVKSVKLKLLLNDMANPSFEMFFYKKGWSTDKAINAQEECQEWQDTLSVALAK